MKRPKEDYKVDTIFSVHLVHKHFDVAEGQVMVYETIHSLDHPTIQVCSPRRIEIGAGLRGKYFLAVTGRTMKAYEYTSDPLPDTSKYIDFIAAFSHLIVEREVERVFALTVLSPGSPKDYTEIKLPDLHATVLVEAPNWLLGGISTDWMNVVGVLDTGGVPKREIYSGTKCKPSVTHSRALFEDPPSDDESSPVLTLDGMPIAPGSEAFTVISSAMSFISVA